MKHMIFGALILAGSPAQAEVLSSSPNGFEIRHTADIARPPATVLGMFERIGSWWDPQHSYSGDAKNLSLSLKPGGCFCEALPAGGGIEHMRVVYVDPGKRAVLTGALGPLLFEAVAGVMDVRVEPAGTGTKLTMTYKAAGFAKGGADKVAAPVDRVLAEQFARLTAAAGKP